MFPRRDRSSCSNPREFCRDEAEDTPRHAARKKTGKKCASKAFLTISAVDPHTDKKPPTSRWTAARKGIRPNIKPGNRMQI